MCLKISSEQIQSTADIKKTFAAIRAGINEVKFYICYCFVSLTGRAIWCQIFARIFQPMMLYVTDASVIQDRKHNRDYERTIEISKLCHFPHMQFRRNFAGLLVTSIRV